MPTRRIVPVFGPEPDEESSEVQFGSGAAGVSGVSSADARDAARVPTPRQSPRHPAEPPRLAVYSTGEDNPAPTLEEQLAALTFGDDAAFAPPPTPNAGEGSGEGSGASPKKNLFGKQGDDDASSRSDVLTSSDEDEDEDQFGPLELPARPKQPQVPPPMDTRQDYLDLETLLLPLRARHVRLVKPSFVIKWLEDHREVGGKPFPHRQGLEELEAAAAAAAEAAAAVEAEGGGGEGPFLDIDEICARHASMQLPNLQVISLSLCWLGADHPDPHSYHLETVAALLRCFCKGTELMLRNLDYNLDDLREAGFERWGGGDGRPVGVFWDWASLYQESPAVARTPEQVALVQNALVNYDIWFAHKRTVTWMLTYLPGDETAATNPETTEAAPEDDAQLIRPEAAVEAAAPGNTEILSPKSCGGGGSSLRPGDSFSPVPYNEGGLTALQQHLALFLSTPQDILNITAGVRENILAEQGEEPELFETDEDGLFCETEEHKCWAACAAVERGNYLQVCLNTMWQERGAPMSPEEFATLINDGKTFAPQTDVDALAASLYAKAFKALVGGSPSIRYWSVGFRDRHIRPFINVLATHCKVLLSLDLSHNKIKLPLEEWGKALKALPRLEKLNLGGNEELEGNVRAMASLKGLKELRLNGCGGVEGDVAGLAPVVHLRVLNLSGTYVYGDVAGLGALTDLRTLYLNRTCIEGNVGGLAPCLKLEYLYLGDTKVTGDVNGLSPKATPLHKLEGLWLVGAQVDGDRVSLLSNLKEIRESRAEEDAGEESVPETLVPVQHQPDNRKGRRRRSIFDGINPNAKPGKLNLTRFGI
jgi:hypothetical protein